MPIVLNKAKIIEEDIEWGLGTITQVRYNSATGLPEDMTYNQISARSIPAEGGLNLQETVNNMYTKSEADGKYISESMVLTKTNSTVYVPSNDYHPATKKYVEDTLINIGASDMAKSIYDTTDNGIVDNAEKLGNLTPDLYAAVRGTVTDLEALFNVGYYNGTDLPTSPILGDILIEVVKSGASILQKVTSAAIGGYYYRLFTAGAWKNWDRLLPDSEVTPGIVPIGSIVMYSGDLTIVPSNWAVCDGSNDTPDLVNRFVMGTGSQGSIGFYAFSHPLSKSQSLSKF